ncbi:MAG: hypothetical protein HUU35_04370 [Armatimonadetes bacterium]|nr:hypothetical protein [Armatimonadota bacterium]
MAILLSSCVALVAQPPGDISLLREAEPVNYLRAVSANPSGDCTEALVALTICLRQLDAASRNDWLARHADVAAACRPLALLLTVSEGRYADVLSVRQAGPCDWRQVRTQLVELRSRRPTWSGLNELLAAACVLDLSGQLHLSPGAAGTLTVLTGLPADVRDALVRDLAAAPASYAPQMAALSRIIQGAIGQGILSDPSLAGLPVALPAPPRQLMSYAQLLAARSMPELAARTALQAVSAAPSAVELVLDAASLLRRLGRSSDAVALYRNSEAGVSLSKRRVIRLVWYRWLDALDASLKHAAARPPGVPTLAEELARRRAAVTDGEPDSVLAVADLYSAAGEAHKAQPLYVNVLTTADEPDATVAAWLGLAQLDAGAAWESVPRVETRLVDILGPQQAAEAILLAGLAAGEADSAVAAAQQRCRGSVSPDLDAVRAVVAALSEAATPEPKMEDLPGADDGRILHVTDVIQALVRRGVPLATTCIGASARGRASQTVAAVVSPPQVWEFGVRYAVQSMPALRLGQSVSHLWGCLVAAAPDRGDVTSLLSDLTEAALSWVDAHPSDLSACRLLNEAAAGPFHAATARPACQSAASNLFEGAVAEAHERGIPPAAARYAVSLFLARAQRGPRTELHQRGLAIIAKCYPSLLPKVQAP